MGPSFLQSAGVPQRFQSPGALKGSEPLSRKQQEQRFTHGIEAIWVVEFTRTPEALQMALAKGFELQAVRDDLQAMNLSAILGVEWGILAEINMLVWARQHASVNRALRGMDVGWLRSRMAIVAASVVPMLFKQLRRLRGGEKVKVKMWTRLL